MQAELDAMGLDVQILSINKTAAEAGVSSFSSDHALPMVQDTSELGLWDEWDATWRDVYIVDEDNVHIGTVNLTGFSPFGLGTGARPKRPSTYALGTFILSSVSCAPGVVHGQILSVDL